MNHIGIDARLNAYRIGGISTYTRQMINALEPLIQGEKVTVFQSRRADSPLTQKSPETRLWTPPHHGIERYALSVELLRHRLDLWHSPDFIPPQYGAKRHVITVHDLTFLHYPDHKERASQRYYNDQIHWAVQHADHILVVSEATRQDLITMLHVPAGKMTLQPHGVNPVYQPMEPAAYRITDLPENYFLFVGTLEPRKNIPALLDAYCALPQTIREQYSLLLVGRTGWKFEATLARIQDLQAQGYAISIRSDIEDQQLPEVYNRAAALILPAFYEGFGLPALEAMACGIPVIVSNTSSLPEVVGEVGALVEPKDVPALAAAMEQALSTKVRQQAKIAGPKRASQFTWQRSAQIALDVYRSLL